TSARVYPWTRRFAERNPIGWRVSPVSTRSARISPITLENLKPWPEHADATTTFEWSGRWSTMKGASGVFVYMQTLASRHSPFARGIRRRTHARTLGGRRPPLDRLRETERRAVLLREPKMGLHRTLRREPSRLPLEHALPAVRPLEERMTPT